MPQKDPVHPKHMSTFLNLPPLHPQPGMDFQRSSPIRVINPRLSTHQLPLPRLISPIPPHQIPVLLRLKHGYQMDARPHFLPSELTVFPLCGNATKSAHACTQKTRASNKPKKKIPFLDRADSRIRKRERERERNRKAQSFLCLICGRLP